MNRIILIGNGFDLAHGLNTRYTDFIDWYWKNVFDEIKKNSKSNWIESFTNDELEIKFDPQGYPPVQIGLFIKDLSIKSYDDFTNIFNENKYYHCTIKNQFLKRISNKSYFKNWVDIEEEYYIILKKIVRDNIPPYKIIYKDIDTLNKNFERVKELLITYLKV